jgi:hypothetical protein
MMQKGRDFYMRHGNSAGHITTGTFYCINKIKNINIKMPVSFSLLWIAITTQHFMKA